MRHFRLNCFLLLAAAILLAAGATALFLHALWPQGILTLIALAVCVVLLLSLIRKLIFVMSSFVSALEVNDTTIMFDFGRSDADMRRMAEAMNRIVQLYHSNMRQVETGKLYYDRILRVMSHEMRNSVTPVISITDDLIRHPAKYTGPKLTEALGIINTQSRGITRFLDAYWQLTHVPSPQKSITGCASFFHHVSQLAVIEAHARDLDRSVCRFTVSQCATLFVDAPLITQALVNLLRNALDAVAGSPHPAVDVTVSMSGALTCIVIADNGTGIHPSVRPSLFQPFVTTKPHGSGVGLCLSRQIVRQHGGELRLISSSAAGTAFAVTLPASG